VKKPSRRGCGTTIIEQHLHFHGPVIGSAADREIAFTSPGAAETFRGRRR